MRIFLIGLLVTFPLLVPAQTISRQVIASTGSYAQTNSLQVSSTVGEVATQTLATGTLILTQGFQQPDKAASTSSIASPTVVVEYEVYPNPTSDAWTLHFQAATPQTLDVRLIDMQGRVLPNYSARMQVNPSASRMWDVRNLAAGTYILRVQTSDGRYQTQVKLQKQN